MEPENKIQGPEPKPNVKEKNGGKIQKVAGPYYGQLGFISEVTKERETNNKHTSNLGKRDRKKSLSQSSRGSGRENRAK